MQGNFWVCPRESASAVEAHQVGRWKWVRAKVSMSAQIETSRSDRAAPQSGAAGAGGKKARREATNSDGAEAEKRAVLSLFRIPIIFSKL